MTSAVPLSKVLTLFSKGKEGAAEVTFENFWILKLKPPFWSEEFIINESWWGEDVVLNDISSVVPTNRKISGSLPIKINPEKFLIAQQNSIKILGGRHSVNVPRSMVLATARGDLDPKDDASVNT